MLQDLGVRVMLVDANARNVRQSKKDGLPAQRANILAEGVIDDLDMSGIGRLLAVTPNDEVNSLAALHFGEVFESDEVFQLPTRAEAGASHATEIPRHLRGRPLFSTDATYTSLDERFDAGAEVHVVRLSDARTVSALRDEYEPGAMTPLFIVRGEKVRVFAEDADITPQPGDALVLLADERPRDEWMVDERAPTMVAASDDGPPPLTGAAGDGHAGRPVAPE